MLYIQATIKHSHSHPSNSIYLSAMEKLSISFWVLIVLFWYTGASFSCREEERNGLLKLEHFAFVQNNSEKSDCCEWNRVKCDNTTRKIVGLNLSYIYGNDYDEHVLDASLFLPFTHLQYLNLSVNGQLVLQNHQDLGRLNKLEVLDLSYNKFNDTRIFQSFSTLTSLRVLDHSGNEINASLSNIGRDLCKLRNLRELHLRLNWISGSIPPCFENITSLTVLDLSNNGLNGSLSDFRQDLCKLKKLRELYLSWNYISRSIPPCFNNLTSLEALDLSRNNLVGFLPDLGRLNKLEVLFLSGNSLNNTRIFQSLSTLTSLTTLDLSYNDINASLSDVGQDLCKLRNLRELFLRRNGISGSIPPCFVNLPSLRTLDLSHNSIVGNLCTSLLVTSLEYLYLNNNPQFDANPMFSPLASRESQLRYLVLSDCNINISTTNLLKILHNGSKLLVLDLSNNKLHGEYPNSIFEKNSNLKILDLRNNSLTGRIHLPVGHPGVLKWFDVSYNHIHGELQPNIGYSLQKLRYLSIANNSFTGEIPTSILAMKDLIFIDLSSNNLSGKLPERLDLSCERLNWIQLSNNRLEGRIPDNIFNLTRLSVLDLSNNKFSGHIQSNNFRSFKLMAFNVNQNRISGRIPSWLCKLTNSLAYLDLSQNQLSGPVSSCLISLPFLWYLYLQQNRLTGPFPKASPFNTSSLLILDVSDNNLSGSIPSWFGIFLDLQVLLLKGNRFSGPIPHDLCRLQYIEIMDISHNILSGSIPLCFTNITFGRNGGGTITSFSEDFDDFFKDNMISDLIIEHFRVEYFSLNTYQAKNFPFVMKSRSNSYKAASISFMSGMDLSCNNLEGDIPVSIGALTELHAMNLSHNRFTGVIPSSMSDMKQIESLDLSHNKLSGKIPFNLTRLTFLVAFSVAYNNLSGRVPEMIAQFSTFNDTSYEGNPLLCGPPLIKQCSIKSDLVNATDRRSRGDDKFRIDRTSFLASFAATYATFLLAFVIVLCINPHWRQRWFYFIDVCMSFVFPFWSEAIHRRRI